MPKRREQNARKPREPRQPGTLTPPHPGSKEAFVIELLRRPEGATIAQVMHETGWLAHTTRSVITTAIGRKRGYNVVSEKPAGTRERVYRIAG